MRLTWNATFGQEVEAFDLRYCCEDCGLFDTVVQRCAHGWPLADHRLPRGPDQAQREVVFCKEFELR